MTAIAQFLRHDRLDRWAIGLSGLCVVHCLTTSLLLAVMASVGGVLGSPLVHHAGLILAVMLGAVALGGGFLRHGRTAPLLVGSVGLAIMGLALLLPHGGPETLATLVGVAVLAIGHLLNRRTD